MAVRTGTNTEREGRALQPDIVRSGPIDVRLKNPSHNRSGLDPRSAARHGVATLPRPTMRRNRERPAIGPEPGRGLIPLSAAREDETPVPPGRSCRSTPYHLVNSCHLLTRRLAKDLRKATSAAVRVLEGHYRRIALQYDERQRRWDGGFHRSVLRCRRKVSAKWSDRRPL